MKIVISGCRNYTKHEYIKWSLDRLIKEGDALIFGDASGVDAIARGWSCDNGVPWTMYAADWETHGKSAGPLRNREMAVHGERLIAFWDGKSAGTANMISEMTKKGKATTIIPISM